MFRKFFTSLRRLPPYSLCFNQPVAIRKYFAMNRVTALNTVCRRLTNPGRLTRWPKNAKYPIHQANLSTTTSRALPLVRHYPRQIRNYTSSLGRRFSKWLLPRLVLFSVSVGGISFIEIYLRKRGKPKVSALVQCQAKTKDDVTLDNASNNNTFNVVSSTNFSKPTSINPNATSRNVFIKGMKMDLNQAIFIAREIALSLKEEVGAPGLVVGVSVDGEEVWKEGFGHSDVENRVLCTPETVMRIASISKSITMTAVARLWEEGKLDFDKPVQHYVPSFPEKTFNGEKVTITTHHLISHISGIRHYEKKPPGNKEDDNNAKPAKNEANSKKAENNSAANNSKKDDNNNNSEFALPEYYIKDKYNTVKDALNLFKDDPLLYKPGTRFLYTTHGFTLLSAVAESAAKVPFTTLLKNLFKDMGMTCTHLDENDPLIYNRARCYIKKKGKLQNAPYVDNSYKWAGGGCVSTVGDLMKFGNAMLYSFQYTPSKVETDNAIVSNEKSCKQPANINQSQRNSKSVMKCQPKNLPGFLKPDTVKMMWTPVTPVLTAHERRTGGEWYGMGWGVVPESRLHAFCRQQQFYITHSGGAVGASSVLFILPRDNQSVQPLEHNVCLPQGVVVVLMANLTECRLTQTALKIAQIFEKADV